MINRTGMYEAQYKLRLCYISCRPFKKFPCFTKHKKKQVAIFNLQFEILTNVRLTDFLNDDDDVANVEYPVSWIDVHHHRRRHRPQVLH